MVNEQSVFESYIVTYLFRHTVNITKALRTTFRIIHDSQCESN